MRGLVRSPLPVPVSAAVLLVIAAEALEWGVRLDILSDVNLPLWIGTFCTGSIDFLWTRLSVAVWGVGGALALSGFVVATVSVATQVIGTRRFTALLAQDEVTDPPEELRRAASRVGLSNGIRLVNANDYIAFCAGLLSPEVWVSTRVFEELSPDELEAVLRHEAWHVRRRDPLKVLVANAARAGFFLLPLVRAGARSYLMERELKADAATVMEMGDSLPLASALYKAIAAGLSPNQPQAAASAFTTIDARIDQLVDAGRGNSKVAARARLFGMFMASQGAAGTILAGCLVIALG